MRREVVRVKTDFIPTPDVISDSPLKSSPMYGTGNRKVNIIGDMVNKITYEGKSAVMRLRRVPFDDPLLTVYFVKGRPIMANSFVVQEPWYAGILDGKDLDQARDNLIAHAYRKYGSRLFTLLEEYSRRVMERVIDEIKENGWDFNISVSELREEAIKRLFGTGSDLSFKVEEKGTLSLLPELNAMGITSVSFLKDDEGSGEHFSFLRDIYERLLSFGIGGHYILFFPYTSVIYGQIKGKDFIGEMEYGPNISRVFPLLKREVASVPRILEEFPWETSGSLDFGRPFLLYLRYKNHGVSVCFRATEKSIYTCALDLLTPEQVMRLVDKLRKRIFDTVDKVMGISRGIPRSVLRVKVSSYVRKYPHPDDLRKALRLSFGVQV